MVRRLRFETAIVVTVVIADVITVVIAAITTVAVAAANERKNPSCVYQMHFNWYSKKLAVGFQEERQ